MKKFLLKWYPLFLITFTATVLRIQLLFTRGDFWFDEIFSIHFSSLTSWTDTLRYWVLETNPPLFTFILRFYLLIADKDNEIIVRLLPLFFGLSSIVLLYIFVQKIFNRSTAIYSSLFLCLSSIHIFVSVEARVYSLIALLAIISNILFYNIFFENKKTRINWILYAITNILLLYSHLTSAVLLLIQFLILQLIRPDKKILFKWRLSAAFSVFLWLIWFLPSFSSKFNLNIGDARFFKSSVSGTNILHLILLPFANSFANNFVTTLFFVLLFIGLAIFVQQIKKSNGNEKNLLIFILTWAILPIILSAMFGVFVPKYVIISYPALYILAAVVLNQYTKNSRHLMLVTALMILFLIPTALTTAVTPIFSWNNINEHIINNETDHSIVLLPFIHELAFRNKYAGKSPLIGTYIQNDNLSPDERIVRYNWTPQDITKENVSNWFFSKTDKCKTDRIFIIKETQTADLLNDVLLDNQWIKSGETKSSGLLEYYLYQFDAPTNTTTAGTCLQTN